MYARPPTAAASLSHVTHVKQSRLTERETEVRREKAREREYESRMSWLTLQDSGRKWSKLPFVDQMNSYSHLMRRVINNSKMWQTTLRKQRSIVVLKSPAPTLNKPPGRNKLATNKPRSLCLPRGEATTYGEKEKCPSTSRLFRGNTKQTSMENLSKSGRNGEKWNAASQTGQSLAKPISHFTQVCPHYSLLLYYNLSTHHILSTVVPESVCSSSFILPHLSLSFPPVHK